MEYIIDLSPRMQRRKTFKHPLLDEAKKYKLTIKECCGDKDSMVMGHLWLVRDVVMRYLAHWPSTKTFTDDMASVGIESLVEFANKFKPTEWKKNKLQKYIVLKISRYINYNRAIFSACRSTNYNRKSASRPLEYYFAQKLHENSVGYEDDNLYYIDVLDSIEKLSEVDKEEMRDLIIMFLKQNHQINEESLSPEELLIIEKLSKIGDDLT